MNKILCAFQNTEAKTLPVYVCVFNRFGWLSPAAVHSADCWFDFGVKWWIHVSSIVTYLYKNPFLSCWNSCKQCSELSTRCCFWSTLSKHSTHFEHCYLMQLQFMISQNKFVEFFGVFWDNCWIWVTWAFSIICVCTTTFKVSIPPPNCCFQWSRVQITLIKPLLCLNSIFFHQKAMLYQHTNFRFFYCFENLQQ